MSELIPGQNTQYMALFWHLLIPMCPSCIAWRFFSLSDGGMMTASPERMGHLQLWVCFCGYGMGIEHVGHHWIHLANLWWSSQQGSRGVGHLGWEPGTQFSCQVWCAHGWWWCLGVSLEPWGVHSERVHLQPASLCQFYTWWWHHRLGVRATFSADKLVYLPDSWCWSVWEAYGHSQQWRHSQRHWCGIILIHSHRWAVHILCCIALLQSIRALEAKATGQPSCRRVAPRSFLGCINLDSDRPVCARAQPMVHN